MGSRTTIFIFLFFCVAITAYTFEDLLKNTSIPKGIIMFVFISVFCILWFKKDVQECKKIRVHSKLDKGERRLLKKEIKNSVSYKNKMKFIIGFIIVWCLIFGICIFVFECVLTEWDSTSWEAVGAYASIFGIIGIFALVTEILPELKNCFPDIRRIFKRYNIEPIETQEDSVHHIESELLNILSPEKKIEDTFKGNLQNGSEIEYNLYIGLSGLILIDIKIDLEEVLKNNKFDLSKTDGIMKRFDSHFAAKKIIDEECFEYKDGIFNIGLAKSIDMNVLIKCEYLIAVIKACQELEDIYNFPFEPTNETNFSNT